jgi:Glycosyltransferase family 9 (heptosyltransferase)
VRFVPHHIAHAASAHLAAPYPDSSVLVLDGRGEHASHLAGIAGGGRLEVLAAQRLPHSLAGRVAELAGLPPSANLAGSGDLLALARAVAAAARVVCGDTGVAHLATALGTPSVVLFGPVPPTEWGPPPDRPRQRALWAGSRGDPQGLQPDPGLLETSVCDVLEALASLPDRTPARSAPSSGRPVTATASWS